MRHLNKAHTVPMELEVLKLPLYKVAVYHILTPWGRYDAAAAGDDMSPYQYHITFHVIMDLSCCILFLCCGWRLLSRQLCDRHIVKSLLLVVETFLQAVVQSLSLRSMAFVRSSPQRSMTISSCYIVTSLLCCGCGLSSRLVFLRSMSLVRSSFTPGRECVLRLGSG